MKLTDIKMTDMNLTDMKLTDMKMQDSKLFDSIATITVSFIVAQVRRKTHAAVTCILRLF